MRWPEPWYALDEDDEVAGVLEKVLLREVGPGHLLYGLPVRAIGRSNANDDVLFRLLDGSDRVADVHLTWTNSFPERPPWPDTALYDSIDAWAAAVEEGRSIR